MKLTILSIAVISLVSVPSKSQTFADSAFRSILPIKWDIEFINCPNRCSCMSAYWSGFIDTFGNGFRFRSGIVDSVTFRMSRDSVYFGASSNSKSDTFLLACNLDTSTHRIAMWGFESFGGGSCENFSFHFSDIPYLYEGQRLEAFVDSPYEYYEGGSECGCKPQGWVSIGGASRPASVSASTSSQALRFSSMLISDFVTRFAFLSRSEGTQLRIFDLLGRERDAIPIAPGSESYEYDASHLTPGLYLATLGGSAVKFVVW
jgi:hypothetical protein